MPHIFETPQGQRHVSPAQLLEALGDKVNLYDAGHLAGVFLAAATTTTRPPRQYVSVF